MTTCARWFVIVGGVLLLTGLLMAFLAAHYDAKVMGKSRLGAAVLGPPEGSAEWQERDRQRAKSDCIFYAGLVLTAFGVILQTVGAVLPSR